MLKLSPTAFRKARRFTLMLGRSRTCRAIAIVFCVACVVNALAQWRVNQRRHPLTVLSASDVASLAAANDDTAFKALLKPLLVERIVGTPQHAAVADYIKRTAEQYGFSTEWDVFTDSTPYGPRKFRNLIATYDPLVPRRLVLACHYDSKILPGKRFIAATDSAVPCAMLLDVARTLSPLLASRSQSNITLQLVFLDGEEAFKEWTPTDSIYGARHLAAKWENKWYPSTSGSSFELSRELDRIDVFMLLDLLGAPNPRISSTVGHGTTELFANLPRIEDELRGLPTTKNRPRVFQRNPSYGAVEDDHLPFLARGVPVLHLITVPFPGVWHTPADDETALDYDTIANINAVVRVFVAEYLGAAPSRRG